MTMSDLRIGVLGCGRIGRLHAELIAGRVDGLALSAVFDVVDGVAHDTAARFGGRVAETPESLIDGDDVDAVAICSSTDTHIDLLVAAAAAGKPVFIEKPLSLDLAQVDRGVAAVDAAGISVQVGFNRRFDPSHRAVRDRVRCGDIGDVHLCRITSRDPAPPPIAYIEVSGGIFNDMTIHDFDMARFVTGSEVVDVFAHGTVLVDQAIGAAGDFDTVVVTMRHENGAITTIDNSRRAVYGYDQRVEVFGSAGLAMSDNPLSTTTVYRNAAGGHQSTVPYFFLDRYIPSYIAEWEAFRDMVRDGSPSAVSIADGRAPLALGIAALTSAREGRIVAVTEVG
jgi:myo-inositol 2-dehydrogenase/D-chiro-inositol 1-dehydrogenase